MIDIAARYREIRAGHPGIAASIALSWARTPAAPTMPWDERRNGDLRAELFRDGFDVTVTVTVDYDADSSWINSITVAEHRRGLSRMGYARSVADEMARGYVAADKRKARKLQSGDWAMYVVIVTAHRAGVELGGYSLGGCDMGEDYGEKFERECDRTIEDHGMIESALTEARATLDRLCKGETA